MKKKSSDDERNRLKMKLINKIKKIKNETQEASKKNKIKYQKIYICEMKYN